MKSKVNSNYINYAVDLSTIKSRNISTALIDVFISRDRNQSRHEWLKESMRQYGLINPIAVREVKSNPKKYKLIFGQGRLEAAIAIGWKTIPGYILKVSEDQQAELWFTENFQRRKVPPYDLGGLMKFDRDSGMKLKDISEKYNFSIGYVSRLITTFEKSSSKLRLRIKKDRSRQNNETKNKQIDTGKAGEIVSSFPEHEDQNAIIEVMDDMNAHSSEDMRVILGQGRIIKQKSPNTPLSAMQLIKSLSKIENDLSDQAEWNNSRNNMLQILKTAQNKLNNCDYCVNLAQKHKLKFIKGL